MQTIHLQSIGEVEAIPASEIREGDVRLYNFGSTALIVKVIEKTPKTLSIITYNDGKYYMFDIRRTSLVALYKRDQDVSEHKPKEAYNVSGKNKGMVNVEEYFPKEEPEEIPVKSITFEWSEAGHIIKKDTIVNTFEAANNLIFDVAFDMQRNNEFGYRKTSFIIEWEDGRTHEGRLDIEQSHFNKTNPIGEHVKYFYEMLAGLRKPYGHSWEEHKTHLKLMYNIDEEGMEEMKRILNIYLLEDISNTPEGNKNEASNENMINIETVINENTEDQIEFEIVNKELNECEHKEIDITASEQTNENEKEINEQTQNEIYYKLNEDKNGVEIYFSDKPSEDIRNLLKANKFRYSKPQKMWYAKQNKDTISLAEQLAGEQIPYNSHESGEQSQKVEYPEISIDDCLDEKYNIPQSIQDREHDANWIFRKNKRDHNKDLQETFMAYNDKVIKLLETIDNPYHEYKIKEALQRFKKNYHELTVKYLSAKGSNPSWAVSGRGNLNMSRYNKAIDRQDKIMLELAALPEEFERKLNYYKNKIRKDKENVLKQQLQEELKQPLPDLTFKTVTKEFDLYGRGVSVKTRFYECEGYSIAKVWGAFRVFETSTGKEIYSTKSNGTLKDAKAYVSLMIKKQKQAS